jgi:hypothetical protein
VPNARKAVQVFGDAEAFQMVGEYVEVDTGRSIVGRS